MPRIPRTEAAVPISYANQPTMDPNALTGPGRALSRLGSAIGSLGGAFEGMNEPGDQDVLASQLAAMDAATESQKYFTERQAALTADTDPDTWHQDTTKGLGEIWENNRQRVPNYPKLQQGYEVNKHRFVGQYDVDAHRKATGVKVERFATSAVETFKGALEGVDPTTPQGVAILETVNQQLARVPGLDPVKAQDLLAGEVLKSLDASAANDAVQTLDKAKSLSETWGQELRATEPETIGPQSEAQPNMLGGPPVEFDQARIFYDRAPSKAERASIFSKGGVVVNLDTNWAKGDRPTSPMVVIPDNASPQQRQAAEAYARGVADVYKQKFGVDLKPKVLTRSQNGRGRGNTIHTEPYSVNDSKAVSFFNSDEGRRVHAQILGQTLGTIPGVHFSIPHDPAKGDLGAHGSGGNEVKFARALLDDVRGGSSRMALGGPGSKSDGIKVDLTAYSPQKGGDKVQGDYRAARPGPDGKAEVRTLADVAAGKSQYVTIAGDPSLYGKSYVIPEISFVDAKGNTQTLKNVKAVVHDTGSAFKGKPEGRFDVAIDRDASEKQRNASHAMWKKAGLTFVPEGQAAAPDKGDARMALGGPGSGGDAQPATSPGGAPLREVKVADASGAIPELSSSRIPGEGLSPSEFTQQQKDAQAAASPGQVRPDMPRYRQPSIRTRILDGLQERMPKYIEAAKRQMTGHIEMAEKSAMEGIVLPPEQATAMQARIEKSGDPELIARWNNANAAAAYTAGLKKGRPGDVQAEAQRLREEIVQGGGTPDMIARVKAVEGLATTMQKRLSDDSLGWAQEAGVIPPIAPIDAETFSVETLVQRKQAVDAVGQQYGDRYRQFFQNGDEKKFLEVEFAKGGDGMISMMGMMYEAFGDDMPKAVAEIAPKAPEAVRAGYLVATGGDPKAVEDIATTIRRRADPNFKDTLTLDKSSVVADADQVLGDVFKRYPPELKDATIRTAEAIYMNRATDPTVYDGELFRQSLALAMGQRENANGIKFGGVVMTREGGFLSGSAGDAIVLPSNIRQDTWRDMLDTVTLEDLKEAGHPLPADGNGAPVSITKALNGRFVQTGIGKYSVAMGDPDARGSEKWVVNAPPETAAGDVVTTETVATAVETKAGQRFELDMAKLAPILRKKNPEFFWSE